ncbi:hypothetical protein [Aquibacillus koreensis]|uniref:hypothetical protein n=1 Tax=Aquibacillus koreensis TaxID=279446 RepID=UPI002340110A|nr:hypothetical protein [Aquibacillus koreensis]
MVSSQTVVRKGITLINYKMIKKYSYCRFGGVSLDRFIFIFGILVFAACLIMFVMNLVGEYDGIVLLISIFGMLNASIAIGVSEILGRVKRM